MYRLKIALFNFVLAHTFMLLNISLMSLLLDFPFLLSTLINMHLSLVRYLATLHASSINSQAIFALLIRIFALSFHIRR